MYRDIDNWVRSCDSCPRVKSPMHTVIAPLLIMEVPGPFQRVSVDIVGPLPITETGNRYVLCFMDHCTRWPILVPIVKTDSATVATAFFKEVICNHGCLEVCKIMRTSKVNSSPYHPQCNAVQERFNAVILTTISHYVNKFHNNWDNFIPAIEFAYRSTPADNSIGFSPFFMLYGREAVLPIDVSLHPNQNILSVMLGIIFIT